MPSILKFKSGFTLIELLVVIAVISLLASVVLVAMNSTRLKARNSKRLSDIRQLTTALNLGLDSSGSGSLPASGGNWVCVSASCYGSWATSYPANAGVDAFLGQYIAAKPTAPLGSYTGAGGYLYFFGYGGGAVSPYDGSILAAGTYLDALMEPPAVPGICGPGRIWDANSNYVECMFRLE